MEKTFQLDQKELAVLQQADQERTMALAQVGALSLDMETARKNLDAAQERQKFHIRQAVTARGIERFAAARQQDSTLIVAIMEEPPAAAGKPSLTGDINKMVERVNGAAEVKE